MNEFILIDAAIWRDNPHFDALVRTTNAVSLYADLPSAEASLFGPWLVAADAFNACLPSEESRELPWRYGVSRLTTEASLASLAVHLESQRSIAMAEGDRYYLRYADTRALDALARVLTLEQTKQLKGPVEQWTYLDRFGEEREFGAKAPADMHRYGVIVLSAEQGDQLLVQQLARALADELAVRDDDMIREQVPAAKLPHVEASAAFVLNQGIEPFDVQRHVAATAIETDGAVLQDARFLARVESLREAGRWQELLKWRVA